MRIKVWSMVMAAVVGGMLITGCARKPKLDLSGLRDNAPDSSGVMGDSTIFEPTEFPGLGPEGGMGVAEDSWGPSTEPLDVGQGGGTEIVPTDKRWAQVVVYFAYDSAVIGPAEKPKLETLAGHLKEHPDYAVVIEGHCDERGSDEYNRALGETRALVVQDYLMALGISGDRLETVSYGEERPVVPNATTEAQHSQNRRAEFVIGVRK